MNLPCILALKRSRWGKRLAWAAAAFLLYTLVGFFLLPPVIKWQMLKRLPGLTKRQAAVRQVKFNPLALSLTIRGLALTEPDGRPFASWEEFYVNFQASSLLRWAWTFKEIRLVQPFGEIILYKDGRLNLANIFEAPAKAAPPPPSPPHQGGVPRVNIFHLLITNGFVALEDRTRRTPFRTEYRPINLELTRFTTRPNSDTPYSFSAESDAGRSVTWAGDLTVQPPGSQGRLEITGVKLSRYQPYLEDFTKAVLTNGLADLKLNYRFQADSNGLDLVVTNASVHAEQMQLQDPGTGEIVAGLRGFDVQQGELNWRERAARLGAVKVSEATVLARLQKNGTLNLLQLLTLPSSATQASIPAANPPASAPAAAPPWSVSVDDFAIQDAAVTLEDLTRRTPFRTELKPLALSLKHFTTKAEADAQYSFQVATEAGETIEGAGTVSINPVRSAGEVKVAAVDVKKYLPYAEDFFRGQVTDGKLAVTVPYHFALVANAVHAGVSNLTLQLAGLEIKAPGAGETVTHVAEFDLARVDASLEDRRARVGLLQAGGASLLARREQDGSLNLLGLLAPGRANDASAGPAALPAQTNGWTVSIDEIALHDCTVKAEDRQLPKPAALLLDQFALNLKGLSTLTHQPLKVTVSARLNETGTFAAQGVARLGPPSADFILGLTNLDLRPFQPWLDQSLRLGIVSGALATRGRLRYEPAATAGPRVEFTGDLWLTNFLCTDEVAFKEFARWQQLAVTGIDCSLEPARLKIEEVNWIAPKTTLDIGSDHKANLTLILKPAAASPANAIPPPAQGALARQPAAGAIPIQIGLVRLDHAAFAFIDETIQPSASIGLQELSGTLKGLSSAMNTTADVELAGKVDEQSPFGLAGRINPLASNLFVDLVISNANTQLTPLTPYLEKYAGHPLIKGRLTTLLRYHVERKELKAENKIDIDSLTLGPRNNSPDATSLPVKLAVALLKDNNGRIELDLPVHGRLDDPQFSVGPIILKVLLNVLTKAVASPFKLLGALVGGGDELSFVSFSPGTTNLLAGEEDKLTKLAKALAKRPALNVEIAGAIDPVADRDALARQKLREQFKSKMLQELAAKGNAPQSVETLMLSPDDYDRLLRAAFAEKFGTNIAAILRTNQLALAATNQAGGTPAAKPAAKPKAPLYRRALALLGLGRHERRSRAEKRLPKADRLALRQMSPGLMETMLADNIVLTYEDYRALMNARARRVQNWLLHDGQVAGDRMLLIAPQPVNASYRGESRANLSLD